MPNNPDFASLPLGLLSFRCGEETERFFQRKEQDSRFCFELFRRAIVQRDNQAWEYLFQRYQRLVSGWVERHPVRPLLEEDTQGLVNAAFEKMWQGLQPEKFAQFPDLKAVLRYLQLCVHSVLADLARAREENLRLDERENEPDQSRPGVEEQVSSQAQRAHLWQMVEERLKTEKERRLVQAVFLLDIKPADVCAHCPGVFQDVREVYLVKDNLMARLRRDTALQQFIENA